MGQDLLQEVVGAGGRALLGGVMGLFALMEGCILPENDWVSLTRLHHIQEHHFT